MNITTPEQTATDSDHEASFRYATLASMMKWPEDQRSSRPFYFAYCSCTWRGQRITHMINDTNGQSEACSKALAEGRAHITGAISGPQPTLF